MKDNLILFPKTLDYYQIELTTMLESERYAEAAELLRFLLKCRSEDERQRLEWEALLHWLESSFSLLPAGSEEPERNEKDILRDRLKEKSEQDALFTSKLFDMLKLPSIEKQLMALDQLSALADSGDLEKLSIWLTEKELHPFVQFRALQLLAERGVAGTVTVKKLGEIVSFEIERTPSGMSKFPQPIADVADRLRDVCEVHDPTVGYLAEQTWRQFLAYIYGTILYHALSTMDDGGVDIWAAALHHVAAETMTGEKRHSPDDEILERYGITSLDIPLWDEACAEVRNFFAATRPF